ncbi:xanthine dehydrogenase small subunit [Enterobacteriaceae bacterium H20N1]|uniref:Xanthine dehydrogenase small subunit n=1 Tax=Dryocola boscaweniae TaxID=2925397 RepID=A0A9X3APR0_9ENTR|nr:xanthine dehydrogenase small subunit [Dryocola boscaweniae]MCT4703791.1 xanthine dehydrogenase small subunit [Dryocola boscaweniae]MCT4720959.1 xanthine dehydrogenase small subunit [Dryocola boscaweniae]
MIQFLLNQTLKTISDVDPNTTVLNWLRGTEHRCGSKEGCASGDCGACTVVLGRVDGDKMRYDTANGCITLISQLDGKQLLTVEDLAENGELHPVQQAMADCHASQCGFCTPGFVMSIFALQKTQADVQLHDIEQHLGGNLCRCTGYRPIIEAAGRACKTKDDQFTQSEPQTVERLKTLATAETATLIKSSRCLLPKSLPALAELYAQHPQARLLAGGTDLALSITQQYQTLPLIIGLSQVAELKTIDISDEEIRIGAAAPLQTCQQALEGPLPAFAKVLERFASRQVRNHGTLGGNLANASPIGDCAPVLLALDAVLELRRGALKRRLPLDEFFVGYRQTALKAGEFISHIIIPRVTVSPKFAAWKISKRKDDDISTVFGAFNLHINEGVVMSARIAFGGMAATPARAVECERALLGQPLNAQSLAKANLALAADFQPLSDFRGSGRYRLAVAQNLLHRLMLQYTTPASVLEIQDYVN